MLLVKKIILVLIALFTGVMSAVAQDGGNGQVEGTITDDTNDEVLIGASVMVKGSSLGSATNADGEYVIRRVPAGPQILTISYLGYQTVEREVEVIAGETIEVNVALAPQALEGQDVTISAQAAGQKTAINEQIQSRSIKNVVSAEKIRELPDESAATALSRLPGVSLQDGDKVVIRGIQAKMNTVMVNGIQLPSTDVNDRSTNLGFISSNMLSGIEVTKAVTPEMDANSIGGVVNLRLQEAPEDWHYDLMLQGGYNTQDQTSDNYQIWGSVSNRFFNNKLGAFLQINARRENAGSDYSQAGYNFIYTGSSIPPVGEALKGMSNFVYGDQLRITEQRGGSLIMDYKLPNGKLVMQNTLALTNNNLTEHRDLLTFSPSIQRTHEIRRDLHDKQLLVNAIQGENDFDVFNITYGLSHAFSEKVTDLRYGEDYGFGFRYQDEGRPFEGSFERSDRLLLTPEDVYDLEMNESFAELATFIQNGASREQNFTERALTASLNVTVPFSITESISGEFQTGGNIRQTHRVNDIERIFARITENPTESNRLAADWMRDHGMDPTRRLQFADFKDYDYGDERGSIFLGGDYDMIEVMDTDLLDQYIRLASPSWNRHLSDSRASDYEGTETLTAGYGMFDINLGNHLELLGGVRYESLNMNYEADLILQTHGVDGTAAIPNESNDPELRSLADSLTHSDVTNIHWFPNLQLRYKPTGWMDVRLAYTKTLSRPDYTAIVPTVFVQNTNAGSAGNPFLKPSVSQNYDVNVSFYNNQIGLFTVGAFYKEIENVFYSDTRLYQTLPEEVIYPTTSEFNDIGFNPASSSAQITTYLNNPYPAQIRGLEFDWQTHFWYLPRPFNNIVFNINYTRIFSEMEYQQINIIDETICEGRRCTTEFTETDTSRTARLLHQGDHLINMALGVDHRGFSGRLSFRMQGDVITSVGNRLEDDAFTGNIYEWDFTLRQRLPIEGLSLFANGINIFHTPNKDFQRFPREEGGELLMNLRRTTYNPRRFQVGIRYSL
ncbi:MAG: TonB-dependent receptor [Balneolaceae bacterium]